MAINIKNLEELIQKKAYAVTSSTPTADLGDIVEASLLATNSLREYDSAGLLPAASSNEKIAFVKSDKSVRFNNGSKWDTLTSGAAGAPTPAPAPSGTQVQGTAYGFKAGGEPPANMGIIDQYSFTSDGNATDYGDLSVARGSGFAACSEDGNYGYSAGGYGPTTLNVIDRFPYASAGNAADVGDLSRANYGSAGCSSDTNGYVFGGAPTAVEQVDRFPFAASANATDIGNIDGFNPGAVSTMGSASSSTTAYIMGGNPYRNMIEKMPFASDGSTVDAGADLLQNYYLGNGNSSDTHGYHAGGYGQSAGGAVNHIQKFPFAVEDNATDVGDMTSVRVGQGGSNSTTHGYVHGGSAPGPVNNIEKYSYTSDGNSTDVGDLSATSWYSAQGGHQV